MDTVIALGTHLREKRESLGMSIDGLAREARISRRYIMALEQGEYGVFPAKVYARGALEQVMRICESEDSSELLKILEAEWPPDTKRWAPIPGRGGDLREGGIFLVTPQRLGLIAAGGLILGLMAFWGARVAVFATPLSLSVESPEDRSRAEQSIVAVKGSAERESRLTVNGRELTLDERGSFNEEIELTLGVNELLFVSESRFGKVSKEVRYVLVE